MVCRDVLHGDIFIFQRGLTGSVRNGHIVVIEKVGEEEGLGAWALKKLVVEKPRTYRLSEYDDEINWDDPVVVLHSYNQSVRPARLDASGRYRVHGVFLRSLRAEDARFVDVEMVRQIATGEP